MHRFKQEGAIWSLVTFYYCWKKRVIVRVCIKLGTHSHFTGRIARNENISADEPVLVSVIADKEVKKYPCHQHALHKILNSV